MVTPATRRKTAAHLVASHQVSQRRACRVLDLGRSSMRYRFRRASDSMVREQLKALAVERRHFGYLPNQARHLQNGFPRPSGIPDSLVLPDCPFRISDNTASP
jgi:hypothetical protein